MKMPKPAALVLWGAAAAAAACCGLATTTATAAIDVTVTKLSGVNPAGGFDFAHGINNAGVVVGNSQPSNPGPPPVAAYWENGAFHPLPVLAGAPAGGINFNALGVNDSGVIVGLSAYPTAPFPSNGAYNTHAARWASGTATDLGTLPGDVGSVATAVNANGQAVGQSMRGISFSDPTTPVRWSPQGQIRALDRLATQNPLLLDLGFPAQHDDGRANAVNATGRAVGYSGLAGGDLPAERLPVAWQGTVAAALPLPQGFNQGNATGVNDAGRIVGSVGNFDLDFIDYFDYRAAVWDETSGDPALLPLPDGASFSFASAVNSAGYVIGGTTTSGTGAFYQIDARPTLWAPDGSAFDLTDALAAAFPAGTRFTLTGINDLGQISGYATSPGFQTSTAFVATVPEPAAAGLLLAVVALGAARRARISHCRSAARPATCRGRT